MILFWIIVTLICAVIVAALWGLWGLVRRDLDRRAAEAVLLENQIAELKRQARHTRAGGGRLH